MLSLFRFDVAERDMSPEMNHHELIFWTVTTVLGLDMNECKCKGRSLRLMVSLGPNPCIGLTKL
jgi:hypothetical protein